MTQNRAVSRTIGNRQARRAADARSGTVTAFQRAVERHDAGDLAAAEALYRQILARESTHAMVWSNLAAILSDTGRCTEAVAAANEAIRLEPHHLNAMINLAGAQQRLGEFADAVETYTNILARHPQRTDLHASLGHALERLGRIEDALAVYDTMVAMDRANLTAIKAKAEALRKLGRDSAAIACFADVVALSPDDASALSSLGVMRAMYSLENDLDDAAGLCMKAAMLEPGSAAIINNLGIVLSMRGDFENALLVLRQLTAEHPTFAPGFSNIGSALSAQCRYDEAEDAFLRALEIDPALGEPQVELSKIRRHLCDWQHDDKDRQTIHRLANQGTNFLIVLMASSASAQEQLDYARAAMARSNQRTRPAGRVTATGIARRLRVGYISADFRDHPVGRLVPELIALHDRSHFEVFGYSLGSSDPVPLRIRLARSFDHFVDLNRASDAEAVTRIKADAIDILVDLTGPTAGGRMEILVQRPAPVQVSFLGIPGTSGADCLDYVVADRFLVPPGSEHFYSEKIARLTNCFQPSDRTRAPLSPLPSRTECGLPEKGFVFCSFNSPVKITPEIFAVWMRLLHAVPGSTLWIYCKAAKTKRNLLARAAELGIEGHRIVFAGALPFDMYLSRMTCADLFLDTHPYAAGATSNDALWIGLPVLTCVGETYVSRMGGSLLTTLGLDELVTDSLASYEARALSLATHPEAMARLKVRLQEARDRSALFDMVSFTADLERAYAEMASRSADGHPPRSFDVRDVEIGHH